MSITRKAFYNFYGMVYAGPYLEDHRRIDVACVLAEQYLDLLEDRIAVSVHSLIATRRKQYLQKALIRLRGQLQAATIAQMQEALTLVAEGRDTWVWELPALPMHQLLIISNDFHEHATDDGYGELIIRVPPHAVDLRKAYSLQQVTKIKRIIDSVNWILHGEAQLVTLLESWLAYALTVASAEVTQLEAMQYMSVDVLLAVMKKALYERITNGQDVYCRQRFLDNFVRRLKLLLENTAAAVVYTLGEPLVSELLSREDFKSIPQIKYWLRYNRGIG